jgi:hypothetical protein
MRDVRMTLCTKHLAPGLVALAFLHLGCLGSPPDLASDPGAADLDASYSADAGIASDPVDGGSAEAGPADAGAPDAGDKSGAPVRLSVRAVEHCAVEAPPFPGLATATPTAARAGVVSVELMRSREDEHPVHVPMAAALVEVNLITGGTLAEGLVPAGTYRFVRYSLAYGSVTVAAVAHSGSMKVPGFLEYDVATAAHTLNGKTRSPGELVARFTAGSFSSSYTATVALDCPLSAAGGVVDTGTGAHRIVVPVPGGPLTVVDGAARRDLEAKFPLAGAVTWLDLATTGNQPGVIDLQAVPTGSEVPARLPICDLLLSDRCEAGATPPRVLATWPMPDSSTTTCTDGSNFTSCPDAGMPGFGQDGNTAVNAPYFVTTADTVLDQVTGLTWQRNLAAQSFDWWSARDYCADLVYAGRDDWSLPSRIELASLLDVGRFGPSIDLATFPSSPADFFWSASPASFSSLAFGIRFDQGFVYDHDPKVSGRARCVAGAKPAVATHLTVVDAATAHDTQTGLTWQRATNPAATWLDALGSCDALTLGGSADWRLPTVKELLSIVEDTAINPSIDVGAFPGTPAEWYWASTPSLAPPTYAWTVSFTDGFDTPAAVTQRYLFRCVHQ